MRSRQGRDELADRMAGFEGMTQLALRIDLVGIAPADLRFDDVPAVGEVGQNRLHGALGDTDAYRQFAGRQLRASRDAQQDMAMIGEEGPRGGHRHTLPQLDSRKGLR